MVMKKMYLSIGASNDASSAITVGIDSVYLQFKGVNKLDTDRFCLEYGLHWEEKKKSDHTRKWIIFLAGGQPITAVYHYRSKITTFQVGRLMDYSTNEGEQHRFVQELVHHFSGLELLISGLDVAVDTKLPWQKFRRKLREGMKIYDSSIYYNENYKTVFLIYSKSQQLGIYSTQLTRFELRLRYKLGQWKVKTFTSDKGSLLKLISKIEEGFRIAIQKYCEDTKIKIQLKFNLNETIENFVAFLHGDSWKAMKDHHKVRQALEKRDKFFNWMKKHRIANPNRINIYVKCRREEMQKEIGIGSTAFKKAVNFYMGISNFKISQFT